LALEEIIASEVDVSVDILVVDDGYADRVLLSQILVGPGRNVLTASSGQEALRLLLDRDFAVILLDVMMPTMDGFELATLIRQRERCRYTPIIFLTAAGADVGWIYRAYSLGAVDYLHKPIDTEIVKAKVSTFVDLFRKDKRIGLQARALQNAARREHELLMAELKLTVQKRYVNLAEAIPHIVWTAESDGTLNYANRRWQEYTGLTLDDARGMGWLQAVHDEDIDGCRDAWKRSIEAGVIYEMDCRLKRASDGACRWHVCRAVPEFDADGKLVAWLGTFTDFEDLKQAVQARDEFISIASHELRTPLMALKLPLETIVFEGKLTGKLEQRIRSAIRQAQLLEKLIDNLLDVSRIAAAHLELVPEPVDLAELAVEVVERLRAEASRSGSQIDFRAAATVMGNWDRMRMDQVITNLLSNAIKYGNGNPILIRVEDRGELADLAVEDQGIGIADADAQRIFGRFERAANRRNQGGLGMGLYIVNQIVLAHGGCIRVRSHLGRGTTFTVSVPKLPGAATAPQTASD